MGRRIGPPSVLAAIALAVTAAGCGGSSPGAQRIHAWKAQPLYLPPPAPTAARKARDVAPAQPVATAEQETASGAPSDAEVAAELKQAFKNTAGGGDIVDSASLTTADLATVPPSAPQKVAEMINAGNQVARKPYVYGGGHGGGPEGVFTDSAYDCSGSVSYALAAAGFIKEPMDSTALANFGRPGPGKWVTIYANAGHAFMVVAGLRFDTVGRATHGSRWQAAPRGISGFTVRHPPGL